MSGKLRVAGTPANWIDRFWSRVERGGDDACWPWTARRNRTGYGEFDMLRRPFLAHRVAYLIAKGDPGDAVVRHACDNPPCCNPAHLLIGTQGDNVRDMDQRGRRVVRTRRGEASNKAKLTTEQARSIFASRESGPVLAERYGISKEAVNLIKRGRNWAHATGARNGSA